MAQRLKKKQTPDNTQYQVTITGTYFSKTNVEKPYEYTAVMEHRHIKQGALSVFKNHIAPVRMPQLYPDYVNLATHEVKKCVNTNAPEDVPDNVLVMNREEILDYIDAEEYPIAVQLYEDTDQLRQAVLDYEEEPEAFLVNQAMLQKRKGDKMEMKHSLLALNPAPQNIPPQPLQNTAPMNAPVPILVADTTQPTPPGPIPQVGNVTVAAKPTGGKGASKTTLADI